MATNNIQYLMQSLVEIHHKFEAKQYQLSSLDRHSLKNLLEQIHLKLLIKNDVVEHVPSKVLPQPAIQEQPNLGQLEQFLTKQNNPPSGSNSNQQVEQVNNEIEEVFAPSSLQNKEKRSTPKDIQLGINERIMFAKELFNDDVSELQESIRKLKSFQTRKDAEDYFTHQLKPYLLEEGKDEEIINEFEQIITRIH